MTTQMRSHGRGLRMPLLALTASASIVGGVFVAAQPAYSVDGVVGVGGQCLTAADEGASIVVSSVVPVGSPLHVEGSGWGASSETSRGFVIVTLDDGQEVRPDGVTLPAWVPASVVRNKTAWSVAEVSTAGEVSADIELPATWAVGSEHSIMIGDGVTGTYVQVSVTVVETNVQTHVCSLTPTGEPSHERADEPSTDPDARVTSDVVTDGPTESPADNAADNAAKPDFDLTDDASTDAASDAAVSVPSTVAASPSPRTTPSADASDTSRSSVTPTPSASASSALSSGGNGSSSSGSGGAGSNADAPSPSPSAEQESVSASQIGPKAHSERQAMNQAVREQESRLNGWILAGGGLLALLGAIVTVSIVRRSHGLVR